MQMDMNNIPFEDADLGLDAETSGSQDGFEHSTSITGVVILS